MSNAVGGEHFFQGLSNSRLDWRVNYARATRDEPDLRETLYERLSTLAGTQRDDQPVHLRRRVAERLPHVQRRSTTTRWTLAVNWSVFSTAGGRPTQYKFGVNYVERTRDFQSRRFHFIPITTQKADTGNLLFDNRAAARGALHAEQHRHGVPVQRGDAADRCLRRRPDDDVRLRHGRHRADGRTRLVAGARVERFDQTVTTQDPFGLFARASPGGEQEHRRLPGRQLRAGRRRRTRTSVSATARRSTVPSSASWRSSSSPTSSATAR